MAAGVIIPNCIWAQQDVGGVAGSIKSLHQVLDELYADMMPLCSQLIGVGRGIAGFAALFYIASRVWKHLAYAEPVDFYPLFRPFVLGFIILIFPLFINMLNGVLQPTVTATEVMVGDSDAAITALLKQKEEAIKSTHAYQMYIGPSGEGDRDRWYKYTHPDEQSGEGLLDGIGNDIRFAMAKASYSFRNSIKQWMSEVLQLLFQAAALCINTLRTFNLIVLAVLGPIVFGLSIFDGFHHTLRHWIARYINMFLWLPVANLFGAIIGKIQENMLVVDLQQLTDQGDTFFSSTDTGYLVFMIIGIVGYFTVPSIANYIMHAGGGSALTGKVTGMAMGGAAGAVSGGMTAAGIAGKMGVGGLDMLAPVAAVAPDRFAQGARNIWNSPGNIRDGYQQGGSGSGAGAQLGRGYAVASKFLQNKISGDLSGGKIS